MKAGARVARLLAELDARERVLLIVAAIAALGVVLGHVGVAIRDDFTALRARVTARERELVEVRRLVAGLRRVEQPTPSRTPLLPTLEAAATSTVGRERLAAMTPIGTDAEGQRVALRVTGTELAEVVRLLHRLETDASELRVGRLELRKHHDDPTRFDGVVEVAGPGTP